ncbi:MAG: hypothetical protein MK137_05585 [Rickettsiales bacterium]|nr:hypothetical protein [Rickettsiales bacterium]
MDRTKSFMKSMGIGSRLYVILGMFVVLSTMSSLLSVREFNVASDLFTTVVQKNVSSLSKSNEVRSSFTGLNSILENALNEENADLIVDYKDNFASLYQEILTSVELMAMEEADKTALLDSLNNIKSQSSLLFDTKQDSIVQKQLLNREVANLQKEHESLLNLIIPVYDEVEFAIMLELDDVLAQDFDPATL